MPEDVNIEFRDFLLRNSHYVQRFENGTIEEITKHYRAAKQKIVRQIADLELWGPGPTRQWRLQRLQNIMNEMQVVLDIANSDATSTLTSHLNEFAVAQSELVGNKLAEIMGRVNIGINRLPAAHVFAMIEQPMLGEIYGDRMLWNNAEAVRAIRGRLAQAIIIGEDMATARKELMGLGREMGGRVGDLIVRRADVIARTEIQRVSNSVSTAVYDANQDVIKGVQWVSTLDRRTCIRCSSLDGKVWYYSGAVRHPGAEAVGED